jgi:hypothetical protein
MRMCQHKTDAIAPDSNVVTGKISLPTETERRQEIDYRVALKLAERDFIRREYQRGFYDAIYILLILASVAYIAWVYWNQDK